MQLNQFITLKDLFAIVRGRHDRGIDYAVYWKDGFDDPQLDGAVLVAVPVTVVDDRDVFPEIVAAHRHWILCSDETLQDVVDVALHQDPGVSDEMLRDALRYYLKVDNFLDVNGRR